MELQDSGIVTDMSSGDFCQSVRLVLSTGRLLGGDNPPEASNQSLAHGHSSGFAIALEYDRISPSASMTPGLPILVHDFH